MMLFARISVDPLPINPRQGEWTLESRFDNERAALSVCPAVNDVLDTFAERPEPPRRRRVAELWLERVYRASMDERDIDAAIDLVLENLDALLFAGDEERLHKALTDLDIERVPTTVLLAFLMGTFRARAALGESRDALYRRTEEKLRREEGARADKLLRGLK